MNSYYAEDQVYLQAIRNGPLLHPSPQNGVRKRRLQAK
jgi:hypothetical protein